LDWIGLDWIGLDWIGLDWIGLDWSGLDCIGLARTQLEDSIAIDHNVASLDVAMNESRNVHVLERLNQLMHQERDLLLAQRERRRADIVQRVAIDILHHNLQTKYAPSNQSWPTRIESHRIESRRIIQFGSYPKSLLMQIGAFELDDVGVVARGHELYLVAQRVEAIEAVAELHLLDGDLLASLAIDGTRNDSRGSTHSIRGRRRRRRDYQQSYEFNQIRANAHETMWHEPFAELLEGLEELLGVVVEHNVAKVSEAIADGLLAVRYDLIAWVARTRSCDSIIGVGVASSEQSAELA